MALGLPLGALPWHPANPIIAASTIAIKTALIFMTGFLSCKTARRQFDNLANDRPLSWRLIPTIIRIRQSRSHGIAVTPRRYAPAARPAMIMIARHPLYCKPMANATFLHFLA
jgi:hypothetical protein